MYIPMYSIPRSFCTVSQYAVPKVCNEPLSLHRMNYVNTHCTDIFKLPPEMPFQCTHAYNALPILAAFAVVVVSVSRLTRVVKVLF